MNNQEFFNQTLNHLRVQGEPAIINGSCRYRGAAGAMCAIGYHIPDDKYDKQMEGIRCRAIKEDYPSALWRLNGVDTSLMSEMQGLHDANYNNLEDMARKIARDFGLTMPEYEWVRMDWVDYQYRTDLMDNPPKHVGYYEARENEDAPFEFMVYWDGSRFRYAKNGHIVGGYFQWRGLRSPAPTR